MYTNIFKTCVPRIRMAEGALDACVRQNPPGLARQPSANASPLERHYEPIMSPTQGIRAKPFIGDVLACHANGTPLHAIICEWRGIGVLHAINTPLARQLHANKKPS